MKQETKYAANNIADKAEARTSANGILEQLASSYTRIDKDAPKEYNIDNCACPSCGCPIPYTRAAGIAGAITVAAATSPL